MNSMRWKTLTVLVPGALACACSGSEPGGVDFDATLAGADVSAARGDPDPRLLPAPPEDHALLDQDDGAIEPPEVVSPNQPKPVYISSEEAQRLLRAAELEGLREPPSGEQKALSSIHKYYPNGSAANEVLTTNFDHICFVAGWKGRVKGSPYYTDFRIGLNSFNNPNNNIDIRKEPAVGVWVRCVPRTWFTSPGGFLPYQYFYNYVYRWDQCSDASTTTSAGNGAWAATVSGFGYDFNHQYDKVWVGQSDSVTVANKFLISPRSPCYLLGYFTSIVLHADGSPARFRGPNGTGQASFAGEWFYEAIGNEHFSVDLGVNVNHQCYYTYVGGNLTGLNDFALLSQTSPAGAWSLSMGAGGGHVKVKVRCIPHAQ